MVSHNQAKLLNALQVKKYRQKYRKFTVEGEKMVAELLNQQRIPVDTIFGTERWAEENMAPLKPFLNKFNPVTEAELKKISALQTPNKVLALANFPDNTPDPTLPSRDWCLYLDGLQDPGNLGAILRVADWFGLPAVFCSPDTTDFFGPKAVQAGMGAALRVPCLEIPLTELLALQTPGTAICGALLDGENIYRDKKIPAAGLLIIGNEGRGIGPETEQLLTRRWNIPRPAQGQAESLNAAVACGILVAALRNLS